MARSKSSLDWLPRTSPTSGRKVEPARSCAALRIGDSRRRDLARRADGSAQWWNSPVDVRNAAAREGRVSQGPAGYREVGCATVSFYDGNGQQACPREGRRRRRRQLDASDGRTSRRRRGARPRQRTSPCRCRGSLRRRHSRHPPSVRGAARRATPSGRCPFSPPNACEGASFEARRMRTTPCQQLATAEQESGCRIRRRLSACSKQAASCISTSPPASTCSRRPGRQTAPSS